MLRHAARQGATVFEETKVTDVEFEGEGDDARPKAATWKNKKGETGTISFDYVIDASGRAGLLSVKYLKNRVFNDDLKNVAVWGYWKGAGKYLPGTPRENSPLFEALGGKENSNYVFNVILTSISKTNPVGHGTSRCTMELCLLVLF